MSEELGETWERASLLQVLAVLSLRRGELEEAEQPGRRCIELKRDLGDLVGMAWALESLAPIAMWRAGSERAATPGCG